MTIHRAHDPVVGFSNDVEWLKTYFEIEPCEIGCTKLTPLFSGEYAYCTRYGTISEQGSDMPMIIAGEYSFANLLPFTIVIQSGYAVVKGKCIQANAHRVEISEAQQKLLDIQSFLDDMRP